MSEEHTPLREKGRNIFFPNGSGFYVGNNTARALIVKACNSHEQDQKTIAALVTACEGAMHMNNIYFALLKKHCIISALGKEDFDTLSKYAVQIRAALAQAKEKK